MHRALSPLLHIIMIQILVAEIALLFKHQKLDFSVVYLQKNSSGLACKIVIKNYNSFNDINCI
jgi:hypothetical protein